MTKRLRIGYVPLTDAALLYLIVRVFKRSRIVSYLP